MEKFFVPILALAMMTFASCGEDAEAAATEDAATEETTDREEAIQAALDAGVHPEVAGLYADAQMEAEQKTEE